MEKLSIFFAIFLTFGACSGERRAAPGTTSSDSTTADACGLHPVDQSGVKICIFEATLTSTQGIRLTNYSSSDISLMGYDIKNAKGGTRALDDLGTLSGGSHLTLDSPFRLTSGDTVYLTNASGTVISSKVY